MNNLPAEKNRRVLVIDDNRAIHDDFRKILSPAAANAAALDATEAALFGSSTRQIQQTQFEVDSAYQGQEGVLLVEKALAAGRPYAMAFVDVRMPPGLDGVETTRKIWNLDPDIQIVICTAYSDYSWGEMFEKLGQRDGLLILKKPFDAVEAFQLAHALTEKWWLHREARRRMEELEGRVAERTIELRQTNSALQTEVVEHTRAEAALQQSQKRLRDIFDGLGPSIFVGLMTPAGILIEANRPALAAGGLKPEDVLGKPFVETYWWAYSREIQEQLRGAIARAALGEASRYDVRVRAAENHLIDVDFSLEPLRDETGQVVFLVPSASVITERKQAETALRESEARTRLLVKSSNIGLWDWNLINNEVFFSEEWKNQLGYTDAEMPNQLAEWETRLHPDDRVATFAAVKDYLEGRRPDYEVEFRLRHKDGTWRWILTRANPTFDATGRPVRLMGCHIDITERKQAEKALRESERRFSDMLGNLDLVSMMLDREARITWCNDCLLQLTGWQREEVIGRNWPELFLPPEIHADLRRVHAALLDDQPAAWHYENEILTRSGARRLIRWNNSVLRSASGEVVGMASIGEDITERKQTEAALQSSEARTKAIVQTSLDGIVAMNHEGRILEFNPAAEKVFGYERAKVLGLELAEVIIPPSLRERHRQGMKHFLATGETQVIGKRIEITAMRSNGSEFPVELAITRMGTEMPAKFTGFIRDISERQRAERQLNIQHAISRVLAESSTAEQATPKILQAICENFGWDLSALWSIDPREAVLRCVEIWGAPNIPLDDFKAVSRRMTFARDAGLPGRVWDSGRPAWIADVIQDGNFSRALDAKQAGLHAAFAFPILIGSGVSGVIEVFSREVHAPDEDLLRTFAVLGSQLGQFFQRRRLEDQLLQSQKMETVGKLAGGVAHEFNSIMTAIIGQSELLLNDLPPGNPLCKNATEIHRAADRAASLTRQLLAYGRKQILRPQILDLNSVLAGMESTLRHLLGRGGDVRIVLAAGLKAVKADAGQIEQVIMNIAMNAADAMPNGGKLTLETGNVTLDQDYVSRFPELKAGEYVMLAITDTGTGMSEAVKARVFEPFFSTKGVGQGTGLGLSTCYGIINQSGGQISLYSEVARGATFKIYLPQVEPQTKIPLERLDSPGLPRGTETVLLVEDDPALREMATTLLQRLGYTVLAAANGIEALSLSQQRDVGHVDLLFTDVVMPHMSGKELSERVQSSSPHTRVLFTSAYTENAIVHQGVLNQGVELLQKPFTPSALAHKLREMLDQPGPSGPNSVARFAVGS
jgi:PAS domain S-box-containing protein